MEKNFEDMTVEELGSTLPLFIRDDGAIPDRYLTDPCPGHFNCKRDCVNCRSMYPNLRIYPLGFEISYWERDSGQVLFRHKCYPTLRQALITTHKTLASMGLSLLQAGGGRGCR